MAGRPKRGIDYAGWSVNMFDGDRKIDQLLDAKGWKGFGVYFFLCQQAYKMNGYYLEWRYSDCATTARKMGGGISAGTVRETVAYCMQIGLFDERRFVEWQVLTSRGIQRRFWTVLSERRVKKVYSELWLLEPDECKGLVKVSLKSDLQPANDDLPPANDHKSKVNNYDDDDVIDIYIARARVSDIIEEYWGTQCAGYDLEVALDRVRTVSGDGVAVSSRKLGLLEYAFRESALAGQKNWKYVNGILNRLRKRGIDTPEKAEEYEAERDLGKL